MDTGHVTASNFHTLDRVSTSSVRQGREEKGEELWGRRGTFLHNLWARNEASRLCTEFCF